MTDTTPPQTAEIPLGIRTGSLALPCYLNGIRHSDILEDSTRDVDEAAKKIDRNEEERN